MTALPTTAETANFVAATASEVADKARRAAERGDVTATRVHVSTLAERVSIVTRFFDEASPEEYAEIAEDVARTAAYLNDATRYLADAIAAARRAA